MFSKEELKNKELAFIYNKIRFENMNNFLYGKTTIFRDEYPNYSDIFITIARFISYKEDIWKKNKKTKQISTKFSKEILDNFVFNGKFTSTKIDFQETRKQQKYAFDPIEITEILDGKETDSSWIIDNIRDCIAHGHYYISFNEETNKIIIKNEHPDRKLECSITAECFFILNELITEERIGGYTEKKLITPPLLYLRRDKRYPIVGNISNESLLKSLLANEFIVAYSQVDKCPDIKENKKYKDLTDFYNYNTRIRESIFRNFQEKDGVGQFYIKKITSYAEHNLPDYDITIVNHHLDEKSIDRIISIVKERDDFYEKSLEKQSLILSEIIKYVLANEEINLEQGVTAITNLYSASQLKPHISDKENLENLEQIIYCNINSFIEIKKLANLFILGINNFVSNKEAIYDKYFDSYDEFNISNFNYQDYSGYDRLINKLKVLNTDLNNSNNSINKTKATLAKLLNNFAKVPEDKKQLILNSINKNKQTINLLTLKINSLINEINITTNELSNAQNDKFGNYICNSNQSFFNHLRNALAHNHIKYADDRIVYNRKIILEDFDDDNKLTFKCECRFYDLVKLFNNDLFLKAINNNEKTLKLNNSLG